MSVDVKAASERAESRIGMFVKDKWRLDRVLGVGGMACVYAATHRNNKRAALKMLHREYSNDAAIRERFLREGYLANSVGHRGVVIVDDDDIAEDGAAFIVMELLDGETLEQRLRRKGHRLPVEEVLAVADQVLDALAAAHEKGVVHRDLKPENLFLTREGVVKVLDFGIGRLAELKGVATRTISGATMGTPAFMAPEQARGRWEDVDGQTDLWALGATLFTLLTGAHVHQGQSMNETLALATTRPARSIRSLRSDLPPRVAALIDRSLAFSKADRFLHARAMQAEVRLAYAGLAGQDSRRAAELPVPDPEPSTPLAVVRPSTDPRLRATTIRRAAASRLLAPLRPIWAAWAQRPWVPGALVAVLGAALALLLSRSCESAGPAQGPVVAAPSMAPAPSSHALTKQVAAPELANPVPRVSLDELPPEPREKKKSAAKPASGKPSGRRH